MRNRITFDDGLILTDADFIGGINYNQNLCGSGDIVVGTVMQQSIKFVVRYDEVTAQSLIGKRGLWEVQWINEDTWNAIGYFNIADVKRRDKVSSSVTAYDDFIHTEIYIDDYLDEGKIMLPTELEQHLINVLAICNNKCGGIMGGGYNWNFSGNETFQVKDNYRAINITAKQVLSYIAQVAGGFLWIDNNAHIRLTPIGDITHETNITNSMYKTFTKALYEVQPINWLIVQKNDDDMGVQAKADERVRDNVYKITNNPLFYAESEAEIRDAVDNVYNAINNIVYVPGKVTLFKDYGIKCGDYIFVDGNKMLVTSKKITASGVELSSSGNQWREATGEDVNPSIVALRGKTNELYRDIEETRSTLTDAYEGLQSEVRQTADSLTVEISQVKQNVETQNGQIAEVVEKQADMELTLDGFKVDIESVEKTANSAIEQTASLKSDFDGFESEITRIETIANTANSNSTTAIEKSSKLEQDFDGFSVKLESVETTANNASSKADSANSKADTANTNATSAIERVSELEQTLDSFSVKLESVETKADNAQDTANNANSLAGTANTNATTAITKTSELEQTLDTFSVKLTNIEKTANDANTSAGTANSNVTELREQISEFEQTLDGFELSVSNVEKDIDTLQEEQASLSLTVNGFSTRISSAEETADGASNKVSTLEQTVDGFDARVTASTSTANEAKTLASEAKLTAEGLTISASNGTTSSKLSLKSGSTTLSSTDISFTGYVKFNDLSTSGSTTINGSNIKTGKIDASLIDVDTIKTKTVYDSSGTKIICQASGSYCDVGGSSTYDFSYLRLYAGTAIYMGMSTSIGTLSLVIDTKNQVIRGMSSSTLWDLGTNAYPFDNLYAKKIYLGDNGGYLSMDANKKLLVNGVAITNSSDDVEVSKLTSSYNSVELVGSTLQPSVDSTYYLGSSTKYWKYLYVDQIYLSSTCYITAGSASSIKVGTTTIGASSGSSDVSQLKNGSYTLSLSTAGVLTPSKSATCDLGSSSYYWRYLYVSQIYIYYNSYSYLTLTCNSSKKLCVNGTAI